jgi:hypothetical protein
MGFRNRYFRLVLSLFSAIFCLALPSKVFASPITYVESDIQSVEKTVADVESSMASAYRAQAHGFSNATLMRELYTPRLWWAFKTPSHIEDEILSRAQNKDDYSDLIEQADLQMRQTSAHPRNLPDPKYFYTILVELLSTPNFVPAVLQPKDVEVVADIYEQAKTRKNRTLQNVAVEFFGIVFEKNQGRLASDVALKMISAHTWVNGVLIGSKKRVPLLSSDLLLQLGQQILLNHDSSAGPLLTAASIFRGLARDPDHPVFEGYLRPASYDNKGAPFLNLRDALIRLALTKDAALTLNYCASQYLDYIPAFANAEPAIVAGLKSEASIYSSIILANAKPDFYSEFISSIRKVAEKTEHRGDATQASLVKTSSDSWLNDLLRVRPS